jgi:GNAT superfamily N-acetyltransferase
MPTDRARMTSSRHETDMPAAEIRPASTEDAETVADLFWRVRHDNSATIPPLVHSLESVRGWVRDQVLAAYDVWVAESDGEVVGFMALGRPDWIEHLYVDSAVTGRGLGSRFVELAKRELTEPIQLWTFQSNFGARRFYERHGFVEVAWTEGDNEEGAPDVRYLFTPVALAR